MQHLYLLVNHEGHRRTVTDEPFTQYAQNQLIYLIWLQQYNMVVRQDMDIIQ
jgi:hypothetical protein